jgi:hypothetical protein
LPSQRRRAAADDGTEGGTCAVRLLNAEGAEVAIRLKRLVADFAGVRHGEAWASLRAAAGHLSLQ